jgi:hypothetical protein
MRWQFGISKPEKIDPSGQFVTKHNCTQRIWNGKEPENPLNLLVAATFEKAITYVFAEPLVWDREVGGSNPLAPTINQQLTTTCSGARPERVANLWSIFCFSLSQSDNDNPNYCCRLNIPSHVTNEAT